MYKGHVLLLLRKDNELMLFVVLLVWLSLPILESYVARRNFDGAWGYVFLSELILPNPFNGLTDSKISVQFLVFLNMN